MNMTAAAMRRLAATSTRSYGWWAGLNWQMGVSTLAVATHCDGAAAPDGNAQSANAVDEGVCN